MNFLDFCFSLLGSFNVWELKSNQNNIYPSSMLWKPVAYLTDERSVEDNTLMHVYDLQNSITINSTVDRGMFLSLFTQPYVSAMKVSIGASSDGRGKEMKTFFSSSEICFRIF